MIATNRGCASTCKARVCRHVPFSASIPLQVQPHRPGLCPPTFMIPSSTEPVTTASVSNRDTSSTENHADYPDADIVLRSSDSQDFQVQKLFILKSSPILNKLIQATSDLSDNTIPVHAETLLLVVQLSEDGTILSSLLTFLLPMLPILPPTLEETIELLSVAQKYEMSHVLVHICGSVTLKDPPLINKSNALYIYSLAQKYGLRQEMVRAARVTLKSCSPSRVCKASSISCLVTIFMNSGCITRE